MESKAGTLGRSFKSLTPEERVQRYREMADAAFLKAQRLKTPEQRAEYLNLAAAWHALARDMETDIRSLTQLEASQERLRKSANQEEDRDLL